MSSVLVEYPEGLPAPSTGEVRPTERRTISAVGQVKNFRAKQRDRHGTRSYAFTFTPTQAAIFREWWAEWLQRGGGWFAANWPLPWSRGPNVFRFVDPPQWQLIGGQINGHGYWRVSGICEIRGRGMLPTVEVMYLTSKPYPIDDINIISLSELIPSGGAIRLGFIANMEFANISNFAPIVGALRDPLQVTKFADSANISNFVPIVGTLKTTQVIYKAPYDSANISNFAPIAGTLKTSLIQYSNWKAEPVGISEFSTISGNLQ